MPAYTNEPPPGRLPNPGHLRALALIRTHELGLAMRHFPSPSSSRRYRVLEIGAGTGQQAAQLHDAGYDVVAIDLADSHYRDARVHMVQEYDGINIPMPDHSADIVFSSNVLEHVAHIDEFLAETRRVLAPGGIAIHVLPSTACRLWSLPAHYLWLLKRAFQRGVHTAQSDDSAVRQPDVPRTPANLNEWLATLFPTRHGERGNVLTEAWYFSRHWWKRTFQRNGFVVARMEPNHLFYTMSNVMTDRIEISTRIKLSGYLGSSCRIYLLRSNER